MRPSTLRTRSVGGIEYWIVRHRGTLKQLGRVDRLSEDEARVKMDEWLTLGYEMVAAGRPQPLRLIELIAKFQDWLDEFDQDERQVNVASISGGSSGNTEMRGFTISS